MMLKGAARAARAVLSRLRWTTVVSVKVRGIQTDCLVARGVGAHCSQRQGAVRVQTTAGSMCESVSTTRSAGAWCWCGRLSGVERDVVVLVEGQVLVVDTEAFD